MSLRAPAKAGAQGFGCGVCLPGLRLSPEYGAQGGLMRLDKFLWFVRIVKSRSLAQTLIADGHLRIDGRVTDRAHAEVRPGMVLSFPLGERVRVLRIEALPERRGPAPEAQACYIDLAPVARPSVGDTENRSI